MCTVQVAAAGENCFDLHCLALLTATGAWCACVCMCSGCMNLFPPRQMLQYLGLGAVRAICTMVRPACSDSTVHLRTLIEKGNLTCTVAIIAASASCDVTYTLEYHANLGQSERVQS